MSCSRGGLADLYLKSERDYLDVNMLGLSLLYVVKFHWTKKVEDEFIINGTGG